MQTEVYAVLHQVEKKHWFFKARRKIIESLLERFLPKRMEAVLLDVGAGTGTITKVAQKFGRVVGIDFSEQALAYYSQQHPIACLANATQLPFSNKQFDAILAFDLLEHLEDDVRGLAEFYRALKPGGCLILTVPAYQFLWGRLDGVGRHYRRYTRDGLARLVQVAGFRILKISYLNTLLFPIVALSRMTEPWRARSMKADEDLNVPPVLLNLALTWVFGIESWLLRYMDLPFGVSIACVMEK